jgi:hypothetical protein
MQILDSHGNAINICSGNFTNLNNFYLLRPLEHWNRGFESRSSYEFMSAFLCTVLCFVDTGFATGLSPIEGFLPKRFRVIVSEVNSDSVQVRGPKVWNF